MTTDRPRIINLYAGKARHLIVDAEGKIRRLFFEKHAANEHDYLLHQWIVELVPLSPSPPFPRVTTVSEGNRLNVTYLVANPERR